MIAMGGNSLHWWNRVAPVRLGEIRSPPHLEGAIAGATDQSRSTQREKRGNGASGPLPLNSTKSWTHSTAVTAGSADASCPRKSEKAERRLRTPWREVPRGLATTWTSPQRAAAFSMGEPTHFVANSKGRSRARGRIGKDWHAQRSKSR